MKLEVNGIRVETMGKVRISYPYLGMGIAFERYIRRKYDSPETDACQPFSSLRDRGARSQLAASVHRADGRATLKSRTLRRLYAR